jgi:hypothetical protein
MACNRSISHQRGQDWAEEGVGVEAGAGDEGRVLYAHGEMYGPVTVTQGSPYMSNAVTHPRYMFWRANFSKSPTSARNLALLGTYVHE